MNRVRNRSGRPKESALVRLWRNADTLSEGLETADGRRWRVVYPGRASGLAGPDFRDCVLETESGDLLTGDVEIHVEAPDWDRHGHHLDPNYNGVVLHVVLYDRGRVTSQQQGRISVPVASLGPVVKLLSRPERPPTLLPAGSNAAAVTRLGVMLDEAGDRRFLARSRGFALELRSGQAEQVLYSSLLEALGYAANRRPFRRLAEAVPIARLRALRSAPAGTRFLAIEATLVNAAGLIDYVRPSERVQALRALGKELPKTGVLDTASWHMFRVRPANHPVRRVQGAAHLVDRFLDAGLLGGLAERVQGGRRPDLERDLSVTGCIGAGRARDVAVNVVLPFLHAWSGVAHRSDLVGRCLELYRAWPGLQENEVTREMRRLLGRGELEVEVRGARRQQGLIQLYRGLTGRQPSCETRWTARSGAC